MRLSRIITGEFAAVFLIGVVVGGLVMWDVVVWNYPANSGLTNFMTKSNDSDSVMVDRINQKYVKEYHLTPDELNRIQPLVKEMAQHMSHIRRQFGIDIISTLKEYHQKIGDQMTPEHRQAFQLANQEREKRMSALLLLDDASAGQK